MHELNLSPLQSSSRRSSSGGRSNGANDAENHQVQVENQAVSRTKPLGTQGGRSLEVGGHQRHSVQQLHRIRLLINWVAVVQPVFAAEVHMVRDTASSICCKLDPEGFGQPPNCWLCSEIRCESTVGEDHWQAETSKLRNCFLQEEVSQLCDLEVDHICIAFTLIESTRYKIESCKWSNSF